MITTLFLDIGGVLLTNGWDRSLREKAVKEFNLDAKETNERHHLVFDTYETGKLTLDEYLNRVVFYRNQPFTIDQFKTFMFESVKSYDDMLNFVKNLKKKYNLKVGIVSNEGRELAEDRIRRFNFQEFVDFYIVSSFVHFRKPDIDIYKIALDISQANPSNVLYLDDRGMFIEIAKSLNIQGIHHISYESTKSQIEFLGFLLSEGDFIK